MSNTGCVFRPMEPHDVSGVVHVHFSAFEEFFLTTLGPRFLSRYYSAVVEDESAIAIVATDRSEVVGFIIGSVDSSGLYGRLLRRHAFGFVLDAIPAMVRNPMVIGRLWRARQKPKEYRAADVGAIFSFAVAPETQRAGIGAALLGCLEREMIAKGASAVMLETDGDDNHATQSFYEKVGFRAVRRYVTREGRQMVEFMKVLDSPREASNG